MRILAALECLGCNAHLGSWNFVSRRRVSGVENRLMRPSISAATDNDTALALWPTPGVAARDHEVEVKFSTDIAGLKEVSQSPILATATAFSAQDLRTVYFDTAANDLWNHGMVLRLRTINGTDAVLCLKSTSAKAANPFCRREIEVPSPELQPNLGLFDRKLASALKRASRGRPLQAKFETRVRRETAAIKVADAVIEIALDAGKIVIGEQKLDLSEVELELKSGEESALYDLALQLADAHPLRLDFISKGQKGFLACTGQLPGVFEAPAHNLGPRATVDDAARLVLSNTLGQFAGNWAAARETDNAEAIHQMRVAMRRLRSGLKMFKEDVASPQFDAFRADAKRIASALGPARDCDVFQHKLLQGPLAQADRPSACAQLLAAVESRRAAAYEVARAILDARETTLFVLRAQKFLAGSGGRRGVPEDDPKSAERPARAFAKATLKRLHAHAAKRAEGYPHIAEEARHKLRIALKELRYGAEFLGGVFGRRRKVKSYIGRVAALQDGLGAQIDIASARHLLDSLVETHGPELDRAAAYILGWLARDASLAESTLGKSWKALKHTDVFWR